MASLLKRKVAVKFSEKRPDVIILQDRISKTSKYSLRPALRARRITPFSRNIQPIPRGAVLVNFGATEIPAWVRQDMVFLNSPDAIRDSANKYHTFVKLKEADVPTVRWTTSSDDVQKWLDKGHKILARHNLASSGGRGISIVVSGEQIPKVPLYTRYFPKTHEFRVHVVGGEAVDVTEKKLREELKEKRDAVSLVRSHDNGWVHAHSDLSVSGDDLGTLSKLGVDAITAVGLDFGAVDILACLDTNTPRRLTKAVVCEVNSAPGIENEVTKRAYASALNKLIDSKRKVA